MENGERVIAGVFKFPFASPPKHKEQRGNL